jgi:tetratricopeptide (TPR) repeat protein
VVRDLGLQIERDDPSYAALMDELDGHPLAMRAVLLRLTEKPAGHLLAELKAAFAGAEGDESTRRIFAALSLLDQGLPEAFTPVLALIGLHRRFVDIDYLEQIAQAAGRPVPRATIEACFAALEAGGLLHQEGNGIYRMHPALSGFLASRHPADEAAQRAFVDFMGALADHLAPKELHEQRAPFAVHGASFHQAMTLAAALRMDNPIGALTQSLAAFALNRRDLSAAAQLCAALAEHTEAMSHQEGQASAYRSLGVVAQEQRDFARAGAWYQKALAIFEQQGNAHGAATTYHQLGTLALEQRDFARAEAWYQKALAIFEQQGDAHRAAGAYHQLGMIAQEQRDFARAEAWYKKALAIEEQQGDAHGAANTYHQLGRIAGEQRDFARAEAWYQKSLAIDEQQGNAHGAARTYHQLGIDALEQRDFARAEAWHQKALAIFEQQGDAHGAASTYHELGINAQAHRDFARAGALFLQAIVRLAQLDDPYHLQMAIRSFVRTLQAANATDQATLRQSWHDAALDQLIPLKEVEQQFADGTE